MVKVAIVGSNDLAQHIAHYLTTSEVYDVVGFYDDFIKQNSVISGKKIIGEIKQIEKNFKEGVFEQLVIGIGYKHMSFREEVFKKFYRKIPFTTWFHPSCFVDSSLTYGEGIIALPGCVFDRNVKMENNIFFNIGCHIAHDSLIKNNCFFAPSVSVAGFVTIGGGCFLGIGTTIIDNLSISTGTVTGGGTVIIKDTTTPGIYIGSPAYFLRNSK